MVLKSIRQISRRALKALPEAVPESARPYLRMMKVPFGRIRYLLPVEDRFKGAFGSREEAVSSLPKSAPVGYDNEGVADVSYETMCRLELWDYPVLLWLQRLLSNATSVIDAGGRQRTPENGRAQREVKGRTRRNHTFFWTRITAKAYCPN